jgi:hypothetical protein
MFCSFHVSLIFVDVCINKVFVTWLLVDLNPDGGPPPVPDSAVARRWSYRIWRMVMVWVLVW